MKAAQDAKSEAHAKYDKAVYVMKVIPGYEALDFLIYLVLIS